MINSIIVVGVSGKTVDALWIESWFDEPQHIHRVRFLKFNPTEKIIDKYDGEQWVEIKMVDDLGRKYKVEMILKDIEPDKGDAWKR